MASGDFLMLLRSTDGHGPASDSAALTTITGANSTSAEVIPVAAFDGTTREYWDFYNLRMPEHYDGGGVTAEIVSSGAADPTTGWAWDLAFRKITPDVDDLDAEDHTYAFNGAAAAKPSAIGETVEDTITFTDGADMDSVGAGDHFILRCARDVADAGDDMSSNDAYLHAIALYES